MLIPNLMALEIGPALLVGGIGLIVGAGICFLVMFVLSKSKKDAALRDAVEKALHMGREGRIDNGGERALHHGIDDFAEFGHVKVLVLFDDIVPCEDRGDRRRVSAGTADPRFLQSLY